MAGFNPEDRGKDRKTEKGAVKALKQKRSNPKNNPGKKRYT